MMSEVQSLPLLPPPPPPLPTLPIKNVKDIPNEKEQSKGQIFERPEDCLSACEQARKAFNTLHLQGLLQKNKDGSALVVSCYNPVKPVLQNGPVCGLVALSMASQLTNESFVSSDAIFSEALKQGFTKQGEMFSVSYMERLSKQFLECSVDKLNLKCSRQSLKDEMFEIVSHLLHRNFLLVPYDADKNHSPCQRKGHKAHWAVITGIVLTFQGLQSVPSHIRTVCQTDTVIPSLFHWHENPPLDLCKDLASLALASLPKTEGTTPLHSSGIFVYGHQGKSKHAGLWDLSELLQSNAQLDEAGPERNSEDYVIPLEGVAQGLKLQMLVVKKHTHSNNS